MTAWPLGDTPLSTFELDAVPSRTARWSAIARRTVYFGHQSLGSTVCAGVEELAKECSVPLRVVQTREPAGVDGPAFIHFFAGRHRDYASKNAALMRLLETDSRAPNPVVLLKYCYGDVTKATDYIPLFEAYRDTVEAIQFDHTDVTLVHSTIPLTTAESGFKARAKRYLGRTTTRDAAIARHRYNELVRSEFGITDPVFDLAKIQAKRPDNTLAGFPVGGTLIETLASENTVDGTDLTLSCRKVVAEALLDVLSDAIEAAR